MTARSTIRAERRAPGGSLMPPKRIGESDHKSHEQREARPVVALAERQLMPLPLHVSIPIVLPAPAHEQLPLQRYHFVDTIVIVISHAERHFIARKYAFSRRCYDFP